MLPQACLWERVSTAPSYRWMLRQGTLHSCSSSQKSALKTWSKVSSHGLGTFGSKLGLGQILILLVEGKVWEQHTGSAAFSDLPGSFSQVKSLTYLWWRSCRQKPAQHSAVHKGSRLPAKWGLPSLLMLAIDIFWTVFWLCHMLKAQSRRWLSASL